STGSADPHFLPRGPGFYLAVWKLLLLAALVWLWVKAADFVARDTVELGNSIGMPARIWNPGVVFSFLVAFLAAIPVPIFPAGLGALALAAVVPFAVYVAQRNSKVTADKKVFTPAHIQSVLSSLGKKGPKQRDVQHGWQKGPKVDLVAVG